MASLCLTLSFFMVLMTVFLFSSTVRCGDDHDKLLQRINSYRSSLKLQPLTKNDNADCLADKIADQLEDEPCPKTTTATSSQTQFSSYPKPLDKCHLNMNNVKEGAILLSCTEGKLSKIDAFNFTEPQYTRYLNKSNYIGAGIGTEDNWVVVVLSTNTPAGNLVASGATSLVGGLGMTRNLVGLFLGFFLGFAWLK